MAIVDIAIKERIATAPAGIILVCNNPTDTMRFTFDAEWATHTEKVARFEWSGNFIDVPFTGNTVNVPEITNTLYVNVGVYSDDIASTPVKLQCKRSVLCLGTKEHQEPANEFSEFVGCLRRKANALIASESGQLVSVWPDENSVIEVSTDGTTVTRMGKNICLGVQKGAAYMVKTGLFDPKQPNYTTTEKFPVFPDIKLVDSTDMNTLNKRKVYHYWNADGQWLGAVNGNEGFLINDNRPEDAVMMAIVYYDSNVANIPNWAQVEIGTVATPFEEPVPYEEFDVVEGKAMIPAIEGNNNLFSNGTTIEATYNKSITKAVEELTNAVISLGGNL